MSSSSTFSANFPLRPFFCLPTFLPLVILILLSTPQCFFLIFLFTSLSFCYFIFIHIFHTFLSIWYFSYISIYFYISLARFFFTFFSLTFYFFLILFSIPFFVSCISFSVIFSSSFPWSTFLPFSFSTIYSSSSRSPTDFLCCKNTPVHVSDSNDEDINFLKHSWHIMIVIMPEDDVRVQLLNSIFLDKALQNPNFLLCFMTTITKRNTKKHGRKIQNPSISPYHLCFASADRHSFHLKAILWCFAFLILSLISFRVKRHFDKHSTTKTQTFTHTYTSTHTQTHTHLQILCGGFKQYWRQFSLIQCSLVRGILRFAII